MELERDGAGGGLRALDAVLEIGDAGGGVERDGAEGALAEAEGRESGDPAVCICGGERERLAGVGEARSDCGECGVMGEELLEELLEVGRGLQQQCEARQGLRKRETAQVVFVAFYGD